MYLGFCPISMRKQKIVTKTMKHIPSIILGEATVGHADQIVCYKLQDLTYKTL